MPITIMASHLKALLLFVSTDSQRPALAGVLVEPHPSGGSILVAADGYKLLAIRDETTGKSERPIVIPPGLIASILKVTGGARAALQQGVQIEEADGFTSAALASGASFREPPVVAPFPAWHDLVHPEDHVDNPAARPHFYTEHLFAFEKAGRILFDSTEIRIVCPATHKAGHVHFPTSDTAYGMIMPHRIDLDVPPIPSWA